MIGGGGMVKIRLIAVTVPVSACWAKVAELMTVRAAEPAKMILAILMENLPAFESLGQAVITEFVPAQDRKIATTKVSDNEPGFCSRDR